MSELEKICDRVRAAAAQKVPLLVRGGGSKAFLGRRIEGEVLDLSGLRGIVHYEPTELVITANAGTPLTEIEAALAERGQMLGFEPPHLAEGATLGGTVACGLSGPARPFRGAARDFVLGVRIINGKGELLSFGGEVMKNVAGYDVARLMCGAYGTLGVLVEISLKVLPRPACERHLVFEMHEAEASDRMREWQRRPLPLSGLCHDGALLHVRLSGAEQAVAAAAAALGGEDVVDGGDYWRRLREQRVDFFHGDGPLWRLSVPVTAPLHIVPGAQLIDWGGALRWSRTPQTPTAVYAAAESAGGHATAWRGLSDDSVFQPLSAPMLELQRRLKHGFDPGNILNPGRMYPEL